MVCGCRYPVNCYNDRKRFISMAVFYIFDLIFFIIRLALVSYDISKNVPDANGYLIPIILFDLISSVPIIVCNVIYVIARCCIKPLVKDATLLRYMWPIGTMTCIRLKFHKERPQSILLTRITIILLCFILRFMCFTISASCSARFLSECTAYTVIAAFALLSFFIVLISEFIHFFRLWHYNPTDTRNGSTRQPIYDASSKEPLKKTHRCHLGFIHRSLLNDQNAEDFRRSRCKNGSNCKSQSLHHYLIYHSLELDNNINLDSISDDEQLSFIAFYQTTQVEAYEIAQSGFPTGAYENRQLKEHIRLHPNIFFTRTCKTLNSGSQDAIICVRLNLGRIKTLVNTQDPNLDEYFGIADGQYDTIYLEETHRFHIRTPNQIEKWIITINTNVMVNDNIDAEFYRSCV